MQISNESSEEISLRGGDVPITLHHHFFFWISGFAFLGRRIWTTHPVSFIKKMFFIPIALLFYVFLRPYLREGSRLADGGRVWLRPSPSES